MSTRFSFVATAAVAILGSSLAAFCQQAPPPKPCAQTQQCPICCAPPTRIIYRTRVVKVSVPAPPSAPAPSAPAPPAPSVTINVPPVNLESLVAPLTLLGNAKMNETHTLDNLGDVNPAIRADLATQYARATIKEKLAQGDVDESKAALNTASAKFTDTQRKWYVVLRVVDDAAGVAGQYVGATKITSSINTSAAGGNSSGAALTNTNTATASPQITGPTVTQNANPTMTGPTTTLTADPSMTTTTVNKVSAAATASQQQGQGQGQGQGQNQGQGQGQNQIAPPPPTQSGGGGRQHCGPHGH